MGVSPGARLGSYEIIGPLGAGGMGEVYRARDTRLGRDVAIKILPAGFAAKEEVRARFEREARTISSLNHPNICTLFDVGREDGHPFLVMELIEGESLADRVQKGPMPLEQVLRYGAQISDALACAHRQGIVHRDLKPGNIMITKSGAKLLDFGLARASAERPPIEGLGSATSLGTQEKPLTHEGTILGTFQYMAPEQLEGIEADARTDIFSFGALLYEMTTGQRAFQGRTRTSLIAAIVSGTPQSVTALAPLTPPGLEHVIRRCLAKEPEDRWQNAADVASELRWIASAGSQAGEAAPLVARRKVRLRTAWALHAVTAALAIAAALGVARLLQEPREVVRTSILPPDRVAFDSTSGAPALSPDGRKIVFVGSTLEGKSALWVRSLSSLRAQPLEGTDGATHPFWSPDGNQIGFFSGGKLRRIDAAGGPSQPICDVAQGRGGAWSETGVILFTPGTAEPLYRVPATGGTPVPQTELDTAHRQISHRYAEFLPGGKSFLFLVEGAGDAASAEQGFALYAGSLDSKEIRPVVATNGSARYAPSGHLFYARAGALIAQRFNPRTMALTGDGEPVVDKIRRTNRYETVFSVSHDGRLLYQSGNATEPAKLLWMDRSGKEGEPLGKPADYRSARLSHGGTRIATTIQDPATGKSDIWVLDLHRGGAATRLTFDPDDDVVPVWSPDDSKIYFTSRRQGRGDIFVKSSFGTGTDELVYESPGADFIWDLSPDGSTAWIMSSPPGKPARDIVRVSLRDGKGSVFLGTPFDEMFPAGSPDGKWLAYVSDESGRPEVYVQSLEGGGGKWQISTDGGTSPSWTRDGREIIYQARGSWFMAVQIHAAPPFSAGVPAELFDARVRATLGKSWDVSADGERFLVNRLIDTPVVEPLVLVQNWTKALQK